MATARSRKAPPLKGTARALRRAAVFVSEGGEFRLAIAIFPQPVRQRYWIGTLTAEAEKEHVHLTECPLPAEGEPRVSDVLTAHLTAVPTVPGHTRAVIVTGISSHLPDASTSRLTDVRRPRMAAELNLDRELFERRCPCPLILALTLTAHGQLQRHAPDLMHWCSQTFDFSEPAAEGESTPARSEMELQSARPGAVYANLTELRRAEGVFRDGLASAIAAYGPESPRTIEVRANLANVLHQMGRTHDALSLSRENISIVENTPGFPEVNASSQLVRLGYFLNALGRYEEAEPILRRALLLTEGSLGNDHLEVANRLNHLAGLLLETNRLAEAEPHMRRALAIVETVLGDHHPHVAVYLNNLASLLKATNRLAEAEPLLRRAMAIDEASFGKDHPNVARSLNNLASLLKATNRLAEAESMMARALRILEESLGKEHPNSVLVRENLEGLQGKMRE